MHSLGNGSSPDLPPIGRALTANPPLDHPARFGIVAALAFLSIHREQCMLAALCAEMKQPRPFWTRVTTHRCGRCASHTLESEKSYLAVNAQPLGCNMTVPARATFSPSRIDCGCRCFAPRSDHSPAKTVPLLMVLLSILTRPRDDRRSASVPPPHRRPRRSCSPMPTSSC